MSFQSIYVFNYLNVISVAPRALGERGEREVRRGAPDASIIVPEDSGFNK